MELISKKDLLVKMNISYSQLYRWKRKKLIPEEWFIKKSVSSGQETFFPRKLILDRIEKIIELKNQTSLDELAITFMEENKKKEFEIDINYPFQSQALNLYQKLKGFPFNRKKTIDFLIVKILQDYVLTGEITYDEGKMLSEFLEQNFQYVESNKFYIFLIRYLGNPLVLGVIGKENLILGNQVKCILEINIMNEIEILKLK